MPLEYKSYGCQFKCGHRHSSSIVSIQDHEHQCWHNPKNRTCRTCKHSSTTRGYSGDYQTPGEPATIDCAVDNEFLTGWQKVHYSQFEPEKRYYLPVVGCRMWEGK